MTQTPARLNQNQQRYVTIHFPDYQDDEYHYGNPIYGFGQKVWLLTEYKEHYSSKNHG